MPVHGDQLFEEKAHNVEWAFQDGQSSYDNLEGVPPEHADWHAKVTLYEVVFSFPLLLLVATFLTITFLKNI